ncbi:MAG TPA: FHA domain-containing protein [Kofleriaceae bacterium]|nr:FHA domain-containing protein [Kofleriaceae bacterium]
MSTLLRIDVAEIGSPPLPPIHLAPPFVIGSSLTARVRLPETAATSEHVKVDAGGRWVALAPVRWRDAAKKSAAADDDTGSEAAAAELPGDATVAEGVVWQGVVIQIASYRVTIGPAPSGATPTPPQRTESLARELLRNLLGSAAAPTLEITSGPLAGAKRPLAAPESTLVIGRGDEANWIIDDGDLSRAHVEIRRTWDGTFITDLDSKNGTKINGKRITAAPSPRESRTDSATALHDGSRIELGKLAFIFRDPAEKHLPPPIDRPATSAAESRSDDHTERGARTASVDNSASRGEERSSVLRSSQRANAPSSERRASTAPFYVAAAIVVLALAGLVWVLSS